jgi:hypothetical protein
MKGEYYMDPSEIAAQNVINQMTGGSRSNEIPTALSKCSQCGLLHPTLKPGERCPGAKVNLQGITNDEVSQFLANLKNILLNNIEKKNIRNPKKLFQDVILKVNDVVTNFKDE